MVTLDCRYRPGALGLVIVVVAFVPGCALLVNPGADRPMAPIVEDSLASVRERGIAARARGIVVPDLDDPRRIREGAQLYAAKCAMCHQVPGGDDDRVGDLMPPAPDLTEMGTHDPRVTFWTIKHGVAMTGMPAWGRTVSDDEVWALTAFVRALPALSPQAYGRLLGKGAGHADGAGHDEHEKHDEPNKHDEHEKHDEPNKHGEHGEHDAPMSLLERMEMRDASGTSWQPESTPMTGLHASTGPVRWMLHGNVFALYDVQGSPRGDAQLLSVNWMMVHARLGDENTEVGGRVMLSLEPLTVGGAGYPLLGQTGETWEGARLVDRQHPHDLFMELAVQARQTVDEVAGVELQAALAGEPALGPTAFPHRASAISDPFAPISHHWQDATHLSFGVLTAGVFCEWAKLEGSWFNGREPDEQRYDLDLALPDSWSSRLSLSLTPMWTAQVSYGRLAEPDPLEPGVPVDRITASTTFDHDGSGAGNWAATAAWGRNVEAGDASDAFLIEMDLGIGGNNVFARLEHVLKSPTDLDAASILAEPGAELTSLSIGDTYGVRVGPLRPGLGVRGNLIFVPADLEAAYGGPLAYGAAVFVQVRPAGAGK